MALANSRIKISGPPQAFFPLNPPRRQTIWRICAGETFLSPLYAIVYLYFSPCHMLIPTLLGLDGNIIWESLLRQRLIHASVRLFPILLFHLNH